MLKLFVRKWMEKNSAILLLGSNIKPKENISRALELLSLQIEISARSRIWETEAVGSNGPNFLNIAVVFSTNLDAMQIKSDLIIPIEDRLGRIRIKDKYAPRSIDIDIILFNQQILDKNIWEKAFIAIPVSELSPDLLHPENKKSLSVIAANLKSSAFAELYDPS